MLARMVALLPNLGLPDAGVFRLGHGDELAAPPGPLGTAPTNPTSSNVGTGNKHLTTSQTLPAAHATASLSDISRKLHQKQDDGW